MTQHIYIFSGLGADERVFQRIDFTGYEITFIPWITPDKNDSIENYASKLLNRITVNRPILIGLSFGGVMAIEVAKQIETEKVIFISSVKTKNELPFYYRWAGQLKLHRLLPPQLSKRPNFITNFFFGTNSSFDKQILKQILIDTDTRFLRWAIDKLLCWMNTSQAGNLVHIHGTADRILPYRFISCDLTIKEGGHLMILNKSEELNKILKELI